MKAKAIKDIDAASQSVTSNVGNVAQEMKTKMEAKFAEWSMKSKVFAFEKKWSIGVKQAAEKIGKALNDAKDDTEVSSYLAEAESKVNELDTKITNELATFETEVDAENTTTKKKDDFRSKMRLYATKMRAKMTGIRTFKDITSLKVSTNSNITSAKTKMSKDLVKSTAESTVDDANTELETSIKSAEDNLSVKIAEKIALIKNLVSDEKKANVDSSKIPKTFDPTNAIDFLENEEFMKRIGDNIKSEVKANVTKSKTQAQ